MPTLTQTVSKWRAEAAGVFAQPSLRVLTIFITNRCNAKCGTCFYWMNLNKPADALTLEEYQTISERTPLVPNILFSGGEPTMDKHIVEVARMFVREPWQTLTMPTNGIIQKQVMRAAEGFAESFPHNRVTIGVSFDGLAETHDRVRGVPRNFERSLETLHALCELRDRRPNMRVTTLTCLLKQNEAEVPALLRFFDENTTVDFVTVEPLRGQRKDLELQAPSPAGLKRIHDLSCEINIRRLMDRHPEEATVFVSYQESLYRTQQRFYATQELGMTCLAGEVTAALDVDGKLRCCELLDDIGNVREHGYSVADTLAAGKAASQRETIRSGACACTHCVNIGHSLPYDRPSAMRRLWRQKNMAWRLFHSPFG